VQLKDKLIQAFNKAVENGLSFKAVREASMRQFENNGFPTIKDEEWKYTNLLPVLKKDYSLENQANSITQAELNEYILTDTDSYLLVFVNGVLSEELSTLASDSFVISTLKSAHGTHSEIVQKYWNSCLPEKTDSLVAMNTALAEEGAFIYVPKSVVVNKPIQIVHATKGVSEEAFLQTRSLIIAEENAQVRITQRHQNFDSKSVFTNAVTEICATENSVVDCYKIQNDNRSCSLVDNTWIQQAKGSNCTVDTFSFGGQFTRNNLSFLLAGEHAESNMNGISMMGQDQLVDHHTFVDHSVPNCLSNELYKGIYGDNAKGVFNGKVMVRSDAQKTNAFQANNNLLLTDNASIDTKPQLEIYADDVACSHGCTIGQLDEEALFYMRSRGIAKKEAQALLMYAFTNDVLESIKIPELQNKLNRIIADKLGVELDLEI
jgi:Fe-S cluster assembly protein SufD